MDRRSFVVTSGAALMALVGHWKSTLADPEPPLSVLAGSDGPAVRVPGLFKRIDRRLDDLRHLDDELGSGHMARLARDELALLVQLIKAGGLNGPMERHAYSLASEASRQVAWNLFDSERHVAAEEYFDAALRASAEARDPMTGAYAMSFMAIQHYTKGNPQDAVNLVDEAQSAVAGRATPRMRAMLAARKARALSKTGDMRGCAVALNQARDLLDAGLHDDDPAYLYWVTRGEVEMIAGSSALELNDPGRALQSFKQAVAAEYPGDAEYPRSHAIYLARAAEAHLELHDLDGAVVHVRHAARCLGAVDSARSSLTLAGLRSKLRPHTGNASVREFLQVG